VVLEDVLLNLVGQVDVALQGLARGGNFFVLKPC
jgi:hypothetical protein